jgi:OmcA/MtrC family decaheme c-type cytochrome
MKKLKLMLLIGLIALSMGLYGCEGDDGSAGPAGAPGAPGADSPAANTQESCNVCHTTGKVLGVEAVHTYDPVTDEQRIVRQNLTATINSVSNVGGLPVIDFSVDAGAGPFTELTKDQLRVVIADIIPAGTPAIDLDGDGTTTKTYGSNYLENWMYETGTGTLDISDAANGNYVYTGDIAWGDASATRANNNEYAAGNKKRVYMRVGSNPTLFAGELFNRDGATFDIAAEPALDAVAAPIDMQDQYVTFEACQSCHGEQLDNAAHASSYYTMSCGGCHSPLSGRAAGTRAAFTASMIHRIHAAIDIPEFPTRILGNGYADVTYPQNIADCTVCHTTDGADTTGIDLSTMDNWKANPTAEVCTSCHQDSTLGNDVDGKFTIAHSAASQLNGAPSAAISNGGCNGCHPAADVADYHTDALIPAAIDQAEFDVTIDIAGATGSFGEFVAGDTPVVTVTLAAADGGAAADYLAAQDTDNDRDGVLQKADLTVYGPRAHADEVLGGGGNLLGSVENTASGFVYTMEAIPADMTAGTYMVFFEGGDYGVVDANDYQTHSTATATFQVGTKTEEPKVAGDCTTCHGDTRIHVQGAHPHNVPFDTDACLACHNYAGGYGTPLPQRVHAVHSASGAGADGHGRTWEEVTYPQNTLRCEACHNSGNTSFTDFSGNRTLACIGCHGDNTGTADHVLQNGGQL